MSSPRSSEPKMMTRFFSALSSSRSCCPVLRLVADRRLVSASAAASSPAGMRRSLPSGRLESARSRGLPAQLDRLRSSPHKAWRGAGGRWCGSATPAADAAPWDRCRSAESPGRWTHRAWWRWHSALPRSARSKSREVGGAMMINVVGAPAPRGRTSAAGNFLRWWCGWSRSRRSRWPPSLSRTLVQRLADQLKSFFPGGGRKLAVSCGSAAGVRRSS